ncbi:MAG: hypothetical protein WAM85_05595 [Terracidiphilus sp.]
MSEMQVELQSNVATNSSFGVFMHSDRKMSAVLGIAFLPWLAVVFFTAGTSAALHLAGYAMMVLAVGYGVVIAALPGRARALSLPLAPALGILIISASSAFWLRLGLPLIWLPALWFALAVPGVIGLWVDRVLWTRETITYGGTLVVLSALICLVYLLPSARNDAVLRSDGSFNWIYVDTQHFYGIAAAIKGGESPPTVPGTATEQLLYHFGPYAPAAAISRLDGLNLGDALARVTRGASLWALVLSCFGVGTLLSIKANGSRFGGVATVAGLFFYGSLLSLFTNEVNSSSYVKGAILFTIPDVQVLADGGPFSHLILGHSMLHGLVAITAIMGICLVQMEENASSIWRGLLLVALPALAAPVNSVAALYCIAVAGLLLFWGRLKPIQKWPQIFLMCGLFLVAWKIMGYAHAPDAAEATFRTHLASQWWPLAVAFLVGLGFRILGFRWISKSLKDPISVLVLASFLGLLSFSLFLQLGDGNERYGIYFLQCMFSIFAFSLVKLDFWRVAERCRWTLEWVALAKSGMILLTACGAFFAVVSFATKSRSPTDHFRLRVLLCFISALLLAGASILMKCSPRFLRAGSAILMGMLLVGFLAWITSWLNFGMGRMKMDVGVTAGEVAGLNHLREISQPTERFATNKHALDSLATRRERSYAYAALSERPVLIEGYLDRGETSLTWFAAMLHDNDSMFTTTNPDMLRNLARTWHVTWLVARPGTDIALPRPLPPWLVRQQDSGSLNIYRVN